ncbi:MAG: 50S ribosomal protein L5 [Nitrospinae bacterium]|nr:50S ribosomal protein L5 [Nitrospinota bacterium]
MTALKEKFNKEIKQQIKDELKLKNISQVPKLEKIVLNVGCGEASKNAKLLDSIKEELAIITGQAPVITRAKKAISNFKLREGSPIGCMVTLRKQKMYDFLERFVNIALPRSRDFNGIPKKSFDGKGNYTLGIKEQLIFPEIHYENVVLVHGMNISFITTATSDVEGRLLLEKLGLPFRK